MAVPRTDGEDAPYALPPQDPGAAFAAAFAKPAHTLARRGPRPLDWTDLASRTPPEREWLIEHWLAPQPTLFSGRGGIGKTLLAQTMATALVLGVDFLAPIPERVNVLLWACEDSSEELWRRQHAICRHFGVDMASLAGRLTIIPRAGEDNTLLATTYGEPTWTPLVEELRQQIGDMKARVVILDNLGHLFGGAENSRHDVTKFVGGLYGMGIEHRASVMLLGHTAKAKDSEFAGSTAWENAVRMRWWFSDTLPDARESDSEEESQEEVRYLSKRKSNYSSRDIRKFRFTDGVLVPEAGDTGEDHMFYALRMRRAENVILAALPILADKQIHVTEGHSSPSYLPRVIAQYNLSEGLTPAELGKAMRELIMGGKIHKAQVGIYPNRSPKVGLVVAS